MTFETREVSMQDGAPIELYEFSVYGTAHRYTTASVDQDVLTHTYTSTPMSRTEIEETNEIPRNDLTITVPRDFPILDFFDSSPPSDVILLKVTRLHRGDSTPVPWWSGRVLNGRREGNQGLLTCESIYTSLSRPGLRRQYSRLCPHVLYGAACKAVDSGFKVDTPLDSVDSITLTAAVLATFPDAKFAGGLLEWEQSPGVVQRRGIKSHVGNTILITHPMAGLAAFASVSIFFGCKHTLDDCRDTFSNTDNYGGFPYIQAINPMGATTVF